MIAKSIFDLCSNLKGTIDQHPIPNLHQYLTSNIGGLI